MAVASVCSSREICYKDHVYLCFNGAAKRLHVSKLFLKANKARRRGLVCVADGRSIGVPLIHFYGATKRVDEQLKALDSYFSKLQDGQLQVETSSKIENNMRGTIDKGDEQSAETGLDSLEKYFIKLNDTGTNMEVSERHSAELANSETREDHQGDKVDMETNKKSNDFENISNESGQVMLSDENLQDLQSYDEASDFSLISILAAINIGVFLFEIATPMTNSDLEQLSLPLIYGAKINKLILDGEWWRLFTPMFLHSGFLHVCLGCWVLLTFAPQVCRGYGPFTFFLIYVLGGICGNLTSFIHTPELTVCGTGPIFAIIGAWFVYQIQNKEVVSEEVSESMFWKAVIATAVSFVLSNFGRIDDWTHLGAMFSGIVYGYFTCPSLQIGNTSPKSPQKEGVTLTHRQADPCKSFLTFTICLMLLSFLVLGFDPQMEILKVDGFIE